MSLTKPRDLKFIIFSLVGVINTLLDFVIYVVLFNITGSIVIANVAATTAALICSYFLNSRLTFKSKQWTVGGFILFFAVTVFGVWFLQTAFIYMITPLLHHIPENIWNLSGGLEDTAKTLVPKVLATVVTFVWNYAWYSKVIFKEATPGEQVVIALEEA